MPFPFILTGWVFLDEPGADVETVLARLDAELDRYRASSVRREGTTIHFRAGMFRFVDSWNLLVPIDHGTVTALREPGGVTLEYRISFVHLFVVTVLIVFGVMAPVLLLQQPGLTPAGIVGMLTLMWLWLFGANLAISAVRFPKFLQRLTSPPAA